MSNTTTTTCQIAAGDNSRVYLVRFIGHWGPARKHFWARDFEHAQNFAAMHSAEVEVTVWRNGITVERFRRNA